MNAAATRRLVPTEPVVAEMLESTLTVTAERPKPLKV